MAVRSSSDGAAIENGGLNKESEESTVAKSEPSEGDLEVSVGDGRARPEPAPETLTGLPFLLLIFSLICGTWLVALNATVIGTVRTFPYSLFLLVYRWLKTDNGCHRRYPPSRTSLALSTTLAGMPRRISSPSKCGRHRFHHMEVRGA